MKFQDSSFNGLKVTVGTKSVTHPPTHAPKAICPINFFKVRGIMILERVALTGKTQKPDRKIETRKGYEEYFLCSPASMFLRGLSNLF